MLLKSYLNDTAQKMLWSDAVHTCECERNSTDTKDSTTSLFKTFYGENPKIIG